MPSMTGSLGVMGSYSRWCANRVAAEADLVFFIGSHTGSQVTNYWRIPTIGTPTIQLDIDPLELGRNYPNTVSLVGDVRQAFAAGRPAVVEVLSDIKALASRPWAPQLPN